MKKVYYKPMMVVEDFTMNDSIANNAKCTFDVNNFFSSQMYHLNENCKKYTDKYQYQNADSSLEARYWHTLNNANAGMDWNNSDNDSNYSTQMGASESCFTPDYMKGSSLGEFCQRDASQEAFANYANINGYPKMDPCEKGSGVNPLQNS